MLKEDNDAPLRKPLSEDEASDKEENMEEKIERDYELEKFQVNMRRMKMIRKKWNNDKFNEDQLDGEPSNHFNADDPIYIYNIVDNED